MIALASMLCQYGRAQSLGYLGPNKRANQSKHVRDPIRVSDDINENHVKSLNSSKPMSAASISIETSRHVEYTYETEMNLVEARCPDPVESHHLKSPSSWSWLDWKTANSPTDWQALRRDVHS